MKICNECRNKIDKDSKFCKFCGTPTKIGLEIKKTDNCDECGYAIIGNIESCSKCGKNIKQKI
jgi:rRNA maturation endonuclease Nob1